MPWQWSSAWRGVQQPIHAEFDVADQDRPGVRSLMESMETTLRNSGEARRNIILAALAELSARYLDPPSAAEPPVAGRRRRAGS